MKRIAILIVLAMISIASAAAQNQSVERSLVGTWTDNEGSSWIFNANGTFTSSRNNWAGRFTSTQIFVSNNGRVFNISMSADGRTVILTMHNGSQTRLLTKR